MDIAKMSYVGGGWGNKYPVGLGKYSVGLGRNTISMMNRLSAATNTDGFSGEDVVDFGLFMEYSEFKKHFAIIDDAKGFKMFKSWYKTKEGAAKVPDDKQVEGGDLELYKCYKCWMETRNKQQGIGAKAVEVGKEKKDFWEKVLSKTEDKAVTTIADYGHEVVKQVAAGIGGALIVIATGGAPITQDQFIGRLVHLLADPKIVVLLLATPVFVIAYNKFKAKQLAATATKPQEAAPGGNMPSSALPHNQLIRNRSFVCEVC